MNPYMCSPTLPDTHSAFSWGDPQIPWPQPAGKADASKACYAAANEFQKSTYADRRAS
jgi:hypothetical protein